jgi:hypothetical protein
MSELVDRIRKELDARIERLRPVVDELERLERAAVALTHAGARALPGLGARPSAPAPASPERTPPGRAPRAKPGARRPPAPRRGTASTSTPADAKPQRDGGHGNLPIVDYRPVTVAVGDRIICRRNDHVGRPRRSWSL